MNTALITGAGTRIGRVFAKGLAEAGWHVAIHYNRSERGAHALAEDIMARGGSAIIVPANLNVPEEVNSLIGRAAEQSERPIKVLINNASTFAPDSAQDFTAASRDHHFNVNLHAPLKLSQSLAKSLPKNETGAIINMLDQRLQNPSPEFFTYSLSKAALGWATTTLAQSLAPRIRVNAISPGPTLKNIHQRDEEFLEETRQTLLRRGSPPETLLHALFYLLEAESVTGQILTVDGGQHLYRHPPQLT